jgi:pantothenate kinase
LRRVSAKQRKPIATRFKVKDEINKATFAFTRFLVLVGTGHLLGRLEADVARSLLFTISNDIGQIACLYAMMHGLKKVTASRRP